MSAHILYELHLILSWCLIDEGKFWRDDWFVLSYSAMIGKGGWQEKMFERKKARKEKEIQLEAI